MSHLQTLSGQAPSPEPWWQDPVLGSLIELINDPIDVCHYLPEPPVLCDDFEEDRRVQLDQILAEIELATERAAAENKRVAALVAEARELAACSDESSPTVSAGLLPGAPMMLLPSPMSAGDPISGGGMVQTYSVPTTPAVDIPQAEICLHGGELVDDGQGDAAEKPVRGRKGSKIDEAIGLLTAHRDWTDVKIAAQVGCSAANLSKNKRYKAARAAATAIAKEELKRVQKGRASDER